MPARSNAMAEITRFWLQSRYGCVVDESIPVKVPSANSDIDLIAVRPDSGFWLLPDNVRVSRLIVETKDEHDWEPTGKEFGQLLRKDVEKFGSELFIPSGTRDVKFTMLRQEHYNKAVQLFGTEDFDRLFVVHALDPVVREELCPVLATQYRIHWMTIREVVADLQTWYSTHPSKTTLRNTLVGDMWHLLIGYCGLQMLE